MGVKFLPFSSDPRAAAAPCPPLPPAAGSAGQGTRGVEGTAVRSHLVPPRWQTRPLDADGMHRERCGQLENRLSPEPCCAVPCCSVLWGALGRAMKDSRGDTPARGSQHRGAGGPGRARGCSQLPSQECQGTLQPPSVGIQQLPRGESSGKLLRLQPLHCTPKHVPCAGTGRALCHHTLSSGSPLAPPGAHRAQGALWWHSPS